MPDTMSPADREDADDEALLDVLEELPRPAVEIRIRVYDQIVRRHQDAIVRLVARDMSDDLAATQDVVQETFTDAFVYLERHTTLPPPRLLGPWLRGVARNRMKAYWRKHRVRPAADENAVGELSDQERARDAAIRDNTGRTAEARRLIAEVEAALSEDDQQLFRLWFTEGLRPAEIAERLGTNPSTTGNRCSELTKKVGRYCGLLLLVRGDRTNCPDLRAILETHEEQHGPRFTAELAQAVRRHLDTCPTCGDCAVCRDEKRILLSQAAPVVFPLLLALALRRELAHRIREVCYSGPAPGGLPSTASPQSAPATQQRPARTGRGSRRTRLGVSVLVAGALIAGVATVRAVWPDEPQTARPENVQVAADIRDAMLAQGSLGADFQARWGGDPDFFVGSARLDMRSRTAVNAATHVLYDYGEGHTWYPPEIVLIGNRAMVTPDQEMIETQGGQRTVSDATTAASGATAGSENLPVKNALEARWLAEPADLYALLKDATVFSTKQAGATRTVTGSTPLRALASDTAVGRFYRPYAAKKANGLVRFTLTVDSRGLPGKLVMKVPATPTVSKELYDPFTVTYSGWATGRPITAPSGPTPSPQWSA
ncbi:RNA polymerase sigma factor [Streptomyces sp. NPDC002499]